MDIRSCVHHETKRFNYEVCTTHVTHHFRHKEIYQQIPGIDLEKLKRVSSTREFDDVISRVVLKIETLEQLYDDMGCRDMVHQIAIPTLFLNASDDPISSQDAIPTQKIKNNPNCILATTERGGHVAWIDGLLPLGPSWMEETCMQYCRSLLECNKSR
jgi:predicted alpha/beta-fold hydrolase